MTNAESIHWAILYLRGCPLPEGPQAAEAIIDMTCRALGRDLHAGLELAAKTCERAERAEAERDALRQELRKWAVSSHTNKCYICNWAWSAGAPQAHTSTCLCYDAATDPR